MSRPLTAAEWGELSRRYLTEGAKSGDAYLQEISEPLPRRSDGNDDFDRAGTYITMKENNDVQ